jgi:hypothetical protein
VTERGKSICGVKLRSELGGYTTTKTKEHAYPENRPQCQLLVLERYMTEQEI